MSTDEAVVGALDAGEPVRGPPKGKAWSLQKRAWCLPGEARGQPERHWRPQERGVDGRQGVQTGSTTDGKGSPQEAVLTARNDRVPVWGPLNGMVWSLQKRAWCPPGEVGGRRRRHRRPQEQGKGGATAQDADMTARGNAPAEHRAAREQRMTTDKHEPRPPLEAPRRQPGRIETRLTGDGDRVAESACGDQGRVHDVDKEQRCPQHSDGGAQQEDAARHSEVWASEPANFEEHWLGETEAGQKELLHSTQEPGEEAT
jgi:hypothetical protein